MQKNILLIFVLLSMAIAATAQVKVGNNPTTLNPSAALEIESANKGFLPPRVSLKGMNDATTIPTPAKGLIVYNSGTLMDEGLYTNTGTSSSPIWSKVIVNDNTGGGDFNKMIYRGTTNGSQTLIAGVFEFRYVISGQYTRVEARMTKSPSSSTTIRGVRWGWYGNTTQTATSLGINKTFTSSNWNTYQELDFMANNTGHIFYLDVSGADEGKFYRVCSYVVQNSYNSLLVEVF